MNRAPALAAMALAALSTTGCTAAVQTTIDSTSQRVALTATFTDEAAQVLVENVDARSALVDAVKSYGSSTPEVKFDEDSFRLSTSIPLDAVASSAPVTGLAGVTIGDGGRRVDVETELPTKLLESIKSETAGQEDSSALERSMLENTEIAVKVRMPGNAHVTTLSGNAATTAGDTATWTTTLSDHKDSAFTVVSSDPGAPQWVKPAAIACGFLALAALLFGKRRRT